MTDYLIAQDLELDVTKQLNCSILTMTTNVRTKVKLNMVLYINWYGNSNNGNKSI